MKRIFFTISFFCITISKAQTLYYEGVDWGATPENLSNTVKDTSEQSVVLKDHRILEYAYDESGVLQSYYLKHNMVLLLKSAALDAYNKTYVPVQDLNEIIKIKARSISASGKIVELAEKDIKKTDNGENETNYYYFPMDGLEIGSRVELLYVLRNRIGYYGYEIFQTSSPKLNCDLEIISPRNLKFLTHSYNSLPESVADTLSDGRNHILCHMNAIDPHRDEEYAMNDASLGRVEYVLAYNYAHDKSRILNYAKAAENYYADYVLKDKKIPALISAYLKKSDLKSFEGIEKIYQLDNYLKSNIDVQQIYAPELEDISQILKNKIANNKGIIRLYIASLNALGIPFELVCTCDRSDAKFDPSFESWNFLGKKLLYLPNEKIYLAPTEYDSRNGLVPYGWTAEDGLFIHAVTVGEFETGVGKVKTIPPAVWTLSQDEIYANVTFTSDFDSTKFALRRKLSGYNADFIQPYFTQLDAENKTKVETNLLQLAGDDNVVKNIKATNNWKTTGTDHALTLEGDVATVSLVDMAGDKRLFHIGQLIGAQSELYNKNERKLPVENTCNRGYHRELTVHIPEGYIVSNPEILNISAALVINGDTACSFQSYYTLKDGVLFAVAHEFYAQISIDLSYYEAFQKVINAAADYEKLVLVLEPKN